MIIRDIHIQGTAPKQKNVAWGDTNTGILKVYLNGNWVPFGDGVGDSNGSITIDPELLSRITTLETLTSNLQMDKADKSDTYTKTQTDNKIDEKIEIKLSELGPLNFKGSKETMADLPTDGNSKGDMWNINADGKNYAWTGAEWDDLGGTVNLSPYQKKEDSSINIVENITTVVGAINKNNANTYETVLDDNNNPIKILHKLNTKAHVSAEDRQKWNNKQDKLTAGEGIVISVKEIDGVEKLVIDGTPVETIDAELSSTSENALQNKVIKDELDKKQDKLTKGDSIEIEVKNIGGENKTIISVVSEDELKDDSTQPVQNKIIKGELDKKQDKLTVADNITIEERVVGVDTKLVIEANVDDELSTTSELPVQNKIIKEEIDKKQDTLTAGNGLSIETRHEDPSDTSSPTHLYIDSTLTAGDNVTIDEDNTISVDTTIALSDLSDSDGNLLYKSNPIGSTVVINDNAASTTTVYSSSKIDDYIKQDTPETIIAKGIGDSESTEAYNNADGSPSYFMFNNCTWQNTIRGVPIKKIRMACYNRDLNRPNWGHSGFAVVRNAGKTTAEVLNNLGNFLPIEGVNVPFFTEGIHIVKNLELSNNWWWYGEQTFDEPLILGESDILVGIIGTPDGGYSTGLRYRRYGTGSQYNQGYWMGSMMVDSDNNCFTTPDTRQAINCEGDYNFNVENQAIHLIDIDVITDVHKELVTTALNRRITALENADVDIDTYEFNENDFEL